MQMKEELIDLRQKLLSKVYEITFTVDKHLKIANATTNSEIINRLGGVMKPEINSDETYVEFYDFNEAKWWNIDMENIVEINQCENIT